ncbi:hypothetical protein BCR35DRAFT_348948 [Leucosporidium creatinivorum]|uniref:F-box domain-containing protein n=1 Tax=Leucosporidium creatinivorum TaxID=106004 RepID=A0A1Y2G3Q4_9BASI|nr:hypothetical protein BCR35DRAFT_348948 [Leucosporidium creatinivorum]
MDNSLEARSPPPSQLDDEALRPLPSLPTEILQRIVQLALPRLSLKTFRERYDTLLNLCRVNKLWAALAQEELGRHAGLLGKQTGKRLIKRQRSRASSPLPIKSLRALVGEGPPEDYTTISQLEKLVAATPKLTILHIVAELDPEYAPAVGLGSLSALAEGLEELAIDYCRVSPSSSQSPLVGKNLRRLTISLLAFSGDYASLLASADLPQLEALNIKGLGALEPEGDNALEKTPSLCSSAQVVHVVVCRGQVVSGALSPPLVEFQNSPEALPGLRLPRRHHSPPSFRTPRPPSPSPSLRRCHEHFISHTQRDPIRVATMSCDPQEHCRGRRRGGRGLREGERSSLARRALSESRD